MMIFITGGGDMENLSVIILAAGQGTRMKSDLPKVLHKVCGKEMISHVVDTVRGMGAAQTIAVIGYKGHMVRERLGEDIETVYQVDQLGTGHAVMQAIPKVNADNDNVLVLYGDTPLVKASTLNDMLEYHVKGGFGATVITVDVDDPTGYGRVIKDDNGNVCRIVEHRDTDPEQRNIREINTGIYCFKRSMLVEGIKGISNDNAQGEYYLTDIVEFLNRKGIIVGGYKADNPSEFMGINTKRQLAEAQRAMNRQNLDRLMDQGVIIDDPATTYVDSDVMVGADTRIMPGTFLEGSTNMGENNLIGPGARIVNCNIGHRNHIHYSVITDSDIGNGCRIGPYAHIRPGSSIHNDVRIGNFVEVKNTSMDDGSKASHLSYLGDGQVGKCANIGCGVVFVNYDGRHKNRTIIEDGAFVGCNVNLVAPVTIKKGAYIAAGSTITKDVAEYCLGIERGKQAEIKDWVKRKGLDSK
jgi:bifunctional UDP-N-acetylglucosamine pyrophosphorylase/glucosamine-1-phosphate N-acetyltransferase